MCNILPCFVAILHLIYILTWAYEFSMDVPELKLTVIGQRGDLPELRPAVIGLKITKEEEGGIGR